MGPEAELVSVNVCDAGAGPPEVSLKDKLLTEAVTVVPTPDAERIVSDTGIVIGIGKPEGLDCVELIVIDP